MFRIDSDADLADVVEERSQLDQLDLLRREVERPGDVHREGDDLLGVVVRVRILFLQRVRERRKRLPVEPLHGGGVLELREQRAGLAHEELAELDVLVGEPPGADVVDLDQDGGVAGRGSGTISTASIPVSRRTKASVGSMPGSASERAADVPVSRTARVCG